MRAIFRRSSKKTFCVVFCHFCVILASCFLSRICCMFLRRVFWRDGKKDIVSGSRYIYNSLSDVVRTIRERFAMRLAKVLFFPRKIYRRSSPSYVFLSTGLTKNRNTRQSSGRAGGRTCPHMSQTNELKPQHFRAQPWQCVKDSPIPVPTCSCSDGLCRCLQMLRLPGESTSENSRKIRERFTNVPLKSRFPA